MTVRPTRRHRSIRLWGYDYSQPGMYFISVCTVGSAPLFGDVSGGNMRLNDAGGILHEVWTELPAHYWGLEIDAFIVMRNHIHGIILLPGAGWAGLKPAPANRHGLPEIVRGFKSFSARHINEQRKISRTPRTWSSGRPSAHTLPSVAKAPPSSIGGENLFHGGGSADR